MHPLHDYIAARIAEQVRNRHAVVIYDPKNELKDFFVEAAGAGDGLRPMSLNGLKVQLFAVEGSFLQARVALEPLTGGEEPDNVVVYVPGQGRGDPKNSLLMEIEKAGAIYNSPALKQIARNVLRKRLEDTAIDAMLQSDGLSYRDLTAMCRSEDGGGSLLRAVFDSSDSISILSAWLLTPTSDSELDRKGAWGEIRGMVQARLGLSAEETAESARLRAIVARYVLANEFRHDLLPGAAVAVGAQRALLTIPDVPGKEELKAVRDLAQRMREKGGARYIEIADGVERDLSLGVEAVPGDALGAVDTFRFEEAAAAKAAISMVAEGRIDDARRLLDSRGESFWVSKDDARAAVWQVCRLMIDLCRLASHVTKEVDKAPTGGVRGWVERYASADGGAWCRLDLAQRRFEALVSGVEDDIDSVAVAAVRRQYEDAIRRMTEGFVKTLDGAGWAAPEVLHQTQIWRDVVASRSRPVAYIFVDAMRYEMGVELADRIASTSEVQLRPALVALPSITPIGMAALLPGSSSSFSVVQQGSKIGSSIDGVFLPDRGSRQKFLVGKIPDSVSLELDDVITLRPAQLKKKIGGAKLIAIHSTDIDGAGENAISTVSARRVMDNVIGDLARCLRNLAAAGIDDAVVTSDHGHLFFPDDRPASMRMDPPGGDTVDLHRRCWIGRGGSTPSGALRVPGAALGYNTDLEFAFPISTAVFKAGGDLAFHHGGPSLQEMVVPVLSVKALRRPVSSPGQSTVTVTHDFDAITNRIFTVKIELGGRDKDLFAEQLIVRPIVVAGDREVAQAALAVGANLQNGRLTLKPGAVASVGFMLTDDQVANARIQILDAVTDAVLYTSGADIPVKLGL